MSDEWEVPVATCDWGDCDGLAVSWRLWTPLLSSLRWAGPIWLPVCREHDAGLVLAA